MSTHPFEPLILKTTKKLLIGTLPPEGVIFYFSNSPNTRLWDILNAIFEKSEHIGKGGNSLNDKKKIEILNSLKIGISDIIYKYKRDDENSTKDKHIVPTEYKEILRVAVDNNITELLFVYQSAFKWFIHSLDKVPPVRLNKLKSKHATGPQKIIEFEGKSVKLVLLPSPLNRGRKGETLNYKLRFYKEYILEDNRFITS